jgi:hypothetical protein
MTQAQVVMVDGKDLPLHCPTNQTPAWNSHCGAEYKLVPGTEPHGH